jgi:hypothetical protein
MAWVIVSSFNIGEGRSDDILIPHLLSSPHIAIKVSDVNRRKWRKAGDIWQEYTGGVRSISHFVPFSEQLAIAMETSLGEYCLRFQPVDYHKGLFVEVWQWLI